MGSFFVHSWTGVGEKSAARHRGVGDVAHAADRRIGADPKRRLQLRWAGKKIGPNPTDRGKLGCKRSVLVDARGVPLSCEIAGANVHDSKLVSSTLKKRKYRRRRTHQRKRLHLHADKGYDSVKIRKLVRQSGFIPHIARKRRRDRRGRPVTRRDAYRWLVEASHAWQNKCRGIKLRWEKKAKNYEGLLHISFAIIALRRAGVFRPSQPTAVLGRQIPPSDCTLSTLDPTPDCVFPPARPT